MDMPGIVQIRDERKDTALIRSAERRQRKAKRSMQMP